MFKNISTKSRRDLNNGQESEIETLQNALQEAMLRERQLIQEKAQREDEIKQQTDAQKQYIRVLLKEKEELQQKLDGGNHHEDESEKENEHKTENDAQSPSQPAPPMQPPPPTPAASSANVEQLQLETEQAKKDLTRVLNKLAQREHEHNTLNEEITRLRVELKDKKEIEKNYRIVKDKLETSLQKIERAESDQKRYHETQTLLQSISSELRETREKNKIIQQEKENLRDELKEKVNGMEELNSRLEKLQLENQNYNAKIQELSVKLEDLSKKGKEQINELLRENEEYKSNVNALNEKVEQMESELDEKEKQQQEEMESVRAEMAEMKESQQAKEEQLEQEMKEKDEQINELELAFKIKEKKKNKLIKELQDQLKKEVIKSQELNGTVLTLRDELVDIKQKNEHLIAESERIKSSSSGSSSSSSSSSSSGASSSSSPSATEQHERHHSNGKKHGKGTSSFVEKEVSSALAKKLEIEVKANFALKEQIKYLTESIQQLHIDLDNKKTVINNLTKRIDIGAIPTNKTPSKTRTQQQHQTASSAPSVSQLQLLMQETTLQNAMLRKDLELMGRALTESNERIKTLQQQQQQQSQ